MHEVFLSNRKWADERMSTESDGFGVDEESREDVADQADFVAEVIICLEFRCYY